MGRIYLRVRCLDTNKVAELDSIEDEINRGDLIVAETEKGEDVVRFIGFSKEKIPGVPVYKFKRKLTDKDRRALLKNEEESKTAFSICKKYIKKHNLKMHLIKAYVPLDASKVFFYYVAENRVDFRALVRDLAKVFKRRIEMRQIGVRDAVQMMGWVGLCGNVPCCVRYIDTFESISLKDIEQQSLPLSPAKFTGPCGRLMCCLAYERENYTVRTMLPEQGTLICIDKKEYVVKDIDIFKNRLILKDEKTGKDVEFDFGEILPSDYDKILESMAQCHKRCVRQEAERENEIMLNLQESP